MISRERNSTPYWKQRGQEAHISVLQKWVYLYVHAILVSYDLKRVGFSLSTHDEKDDT